jgi:hypothetical protein
MKFDWRRERLLDWLCSIADDREPKTQKELAEELGATQSELSKWKAEPDFLAAWETRYRKTVGSPEKAHQVLASLHETAVDRTDPRQVQAARAYLEAIDAIKPKKVDVTVTQGRAAKDLSDDELFAMMADRATSELANRLEEREVNDSD